ncbi:MAG: AAA family ATPase [Clostridia bacterium]|nr:AAA family ATPase [Clostridia bacterium]
MDFKNIIGNDSLRSLIGNHIKNKTLSHAYIIEGPKGSGKRTLAKEICKALMCESPSPDLPCGSCRSCKRIEEGYNTDIFVLTRGDKATIPVEEVRNMTATLGYYPDDGDCKVYIIEDADRMTPQAQNALLLSLEEPPSYVVFLLLTEDSTALLETVRSRAQRLKTEVFSPAFTAEWLKKQPAAAKASENAISSAATVSRGSLGLALSTLSSKSTKEASISADASRLVELLCTGSRAEAIVFASGIKYSRAEFEQFFDYAILAVRDILYAKYSSFTPAYYTDSSIPKELSSKLKMTKLTHIYDALICAKDDITRYNAQTYAVMTTLAASAL